jgi:hypothetical protein
MFLVACSDFTHRLPHIHPIARYASYLINARLCKGIKIMLWLQMVLDGLYAILRPVLLKRFDILYTAGLLKVKVTHGFRVVVV